MGVHWNTSRGPWVGVRYRPDAVWSVWATLRWLTGETDIRPLIVWSRR